jgi:hypothetical protein
MVPERAATMADVCEYLAQRYTRNNRPIALYLDSFRVPPAEPAALLKHDDVVTYESNPHMCVSLIRYESQCQAGQDRRSPQSSRTSSFAKQEAQGQQQQQQQ